MTAELGLILPHTGKLWRSLTKTGISKPSAFTAGSEVEAPVGPSWGSLEESGGGQEVNLGAVFSGGTAHFPLTHAD